VPRPRSERPGTALDLVSPAEQLRAVVASAAQLTSKNMVRPKSTGTGGDWQNEAWYFYDTVGEYRFGINWKAQALSRCDLYIEEQQESGEWEPVTDGPEVVILDTIMGAAREQKMSAFGLHLEVPGESYLVGEVLDPFDRPDPNGTEQWRVYSQEELRPKGTDTGEWLLDRGDGKPRTLDTTADAGPVVFRIWRPHPRKYVEADSPSRASLPILREIENLTKKVAAEIDSRLAGAGILFVPQEMTFSGMAGPSATQGVVQTEGADDNPPDPVAQDPQQSVNKFLADVMEAMVTPLSNRDHPSSVVPVIVKAPGQWLDKVKHLSFSTPLDERTLELRESRLKALAVSADMPAEIILGIGDVNHWGAWQLEESAIKVHIDPLGSVVADAFTEKIIPWALEQMGQAVNPRRRVALDTANLRLRPDRTQQAQYLYDKLELDGEGLRRELGIEGDAPKPEELQRSLLLRTAVGVTTPDVVLAALAKLGVLLDVQPVESRTGLPPTEVIPKGDTVAPKELPAGETGPPADDGPPAPEEPATAASGYTPAEAAVLAAAELLVKRAVERANNRVNNRSRVRKPIPVDKLDAALAGAWDEVPRTCELLGVDAGWFTERLERYARGVLTTGEDHSPDVLERVLGSQ
jgi:hypothetical protein